MTQDEKIQEAFDRMGLGTQEERDKFKFDFSFGHQTNHTQHQTWLGAHTDELEVEGAELEHVAGGDQ